MKTDNMRIWEALGKTRGCFWCLVDTSNPDGCWLWKGRTNYSGYGLFSKYRAHRVSWILAYSKIPEGMCICHHCDVRSCVNPNHLFLGTQTDNAHDMYQKQRQGPRHCGERNAASVLTPEDVQAIRSSTHSLSLAAQQFGITKANVSLIRRGKTWRHVNV